MPFADTACGQGRERETAVKLTDALLGEHGVFYVLFNQIEEIAAIESPLAQIRGATTVFQLRAKLLPRRVAHNS